MMKTHCVRAGIVVLASVLVAATGAFCGADIQEAVSSRPSPAEWEQWQPEVDRADERLQSSMVSVWQSETTIGEVLEELSEQSAVQLEAALGLVRVRVTVFAEDRTLAGVMSCLAHLVTGYWVFPRGEEPAERSYRFVQHEIPAELGEAWPEEHWRELRRARAAEKRPERKARIALYRRALDMSTSEVLVEYEETDPWLCADLLNPAVRPMIEEYFRLSEGTREGLLATGTVGVPLREFDGGFREHLAQWSKGRWGRPAMLQAGPDADRMCRFTSPEERWANSVVYFRWSDSALQCQLAIPDVARFDADIMRTPRRPPYYAREQLVSLGHCEGTREYWQGARQEAEEWERQWEARQESEAEEPQPYSRSLPAPNMTDPRLCLSLDLEGAEAQALASSAVLEEAARQCEIAVVACYLPPEWVRLAPAAADEQGGTLGAALSEIRSQRAGMFWWNFCGQYLVAGDAEYWLIEASDVSQETLEHWQHVLRPGGSFTLDEVAAMLAELNELQLNFLVDRLTGLHELPIYSLRLYGCLDSEQREEAQSAEGLRLSRLSADEQDSVLRFARNARPWLERADLENAVLRLVPRRLSTGKAGKSLVAEYRLPDSSQDRDILFTCPLSYTVGEDGFIG